MPPGQRLSRDRSSPQAAPLKRRPSDDDEFLPSSYPQDKYMMSHSSYLAKEKAAALHKLDRNRPPHHQSTPIIQPDCEVCKSDFWLSDKEIGTGSYGRVVIARYRNATCAAKVLHPIFREDFQGIAIVQKFLVECERLSKIRSPRIVQFLGVYLGCEGPVLFMELMKCDLTSRLSKKPELIPTEKLRIALDVTEGLADLHSRSIVHQDLTGKNVLLDDGTRAKIGDIGASCLVDLQHQGTKVPGATFYMPPEAFTDNPGCQTSFDMFSFGVLLIQLFTNMFPEPEEKSCASELDRRKDHLDLMKGVLNSVGGLESIQELVIQCLSVNPEDRPTAADACETLQAVQPSERSDGFLIPSSQDDEAFTMEADDISPSGELQTQHAPIPPPLSVSVQTDASLVPSPICASEPDRNEETANEVAPQQASSPGPGKMLPGGFNPTSLSALTVSETEQAQLVTPEKEVAEESGDNTNHPIQEDSSPSESKHSDTELVLPTRSVTDTKPSPQHDKKEQDSSVSVFNSELCHSNILPNHASTTAATQSSTKRPEDSKLSVAMDKALVLHPMDNGRLTDGDPSTTSGTSLSSEESSASTSGTSTERRSNDFGLSVHENPSPAFGTPSDRGRSSLGDLSPTTLHPTNSARIDSLTDMSPSVTVAKLEDSENRSPRPLGTISSSLPPDGEESQHTPNTATNPDSAVGIHVQQKDARPPTDINPSTATVVPPGGESSSTTGRPIDTQAMELENSTAAETLSNGKGESLSTVISSSTKVQQTTKRAEAEGVVALRKDTHSTAVEMPVLVHLPAEEEATDRKGTKTSKLVVSQPDGGENCPLTCVKSNLAAIKSSQELKPMDSKDDNCLSDVPPSEPTAAPASAEPSEIPAIISSIKLQSVDEIDATCLSDLAPPETTMVPETAEQSETQPTTSSTKLHPMDSKDASSSSDVATSAIVEHTKTTAAIASTWLQPTDSKNGKSLSHVAAPATTLVLANAEQSERTDAMSSTCTGQHPRDSKDAKSPSRVPPSATPVGPANAEQTKSPASISSSDIQLMDTKKAKPFSGVPPSVTTVGPGNAEQNKTLAISLSTEQCPPAIVSTNLQPVNSTLANPSPDVHLQATMTVPSYAQHDNPLSCATKTSEVKGENVSPSTDLEPSTDAEVPLIKEDPSFSMGIGSPTNVHPMENTADCEPLNSQPPSVKEAPFNVPEMCKSPAALTSSQDTPPIEEDVMTPSRKGVEPPKKDATPPKKGDNTPPNREDTTSGSSHSPQSSLEIAGSRIHHVLETGKSPAALTSSRETPPMEEDVMTPSRKRVKPPKKDATPPKKGDNTPPNREDTMPRSSHSPQSSLEIAGSRIHHVLETGKSPAALTSSRETPPMEEDVVTPSRKRVKKDATPPKKGDNTPPNREDTTPGSSHSPQSSLEIAGSRIHHVLETGKSPAALTSSQETPPMKEDVMTPSRKRVKPPKKDATPPKKGDNTPPNREDTMPRSSHSPQSSLEIAGSRIHHVLETGKSPAALTSSRETPPMEEDVMTPSRKRVKPPKKDATPPKKGDNTPPNREDTTPGSSHSPQSSLEIAGSRIHHVRPRCRKSQGKHPDRHNPSKSRHKGPRVPKSQSKCCTKAPRKAASKHKSHMSSIRQPSIRECSTGGRDREREEDTCRDENDHMNDDGSNSSTDEEVGIGKEEERVKKAEPSDEQVLTKTSKPDPGFSTPANCQDEVQPNGHQSSFQVTEKIQNCKQWGRETASPTSLLTKTQRNDRQEPKRSSKSSSSKEARNAGSVPGSVVVSRSCSYVEMQKRRIRRPRKRRRRFKFHGSQTRPPDKSTVCRPSKVKPVRTRTKIARSHSQWNTPRTAARRRKLHRPCRKSQARPPENTCGNNKGSKTSKSQPKSGTSSKTASGQKSHGCSTTVSTQPCTGACSSGGTDGGGSEGEGDDDDDVKDRDKHCKCSRSSEQDEDEEEEKNKEQDEDEKEEGDETMLTETKSPSSLTTSDPLSSPSPNSPDSGDIDDGQGDDQAQEVKEHRKKIRKKSDSQGTSHSPSKESDTCKTESASNETNFTEGLPQSLHSEGTKDDPERDFPEVNKKKPPDKSSERPDLSATGTTPPTPEANVESKQVPLPSSQPQGLPLADADHENGLANHAPSLDEHPDAALPPAPNINENDHVQQPPIGHPPSMQQVHPHQLQPFVGVIENHPDDSNSSDDVLSVGGQKSEPTEDDLSSGALPDEYVDVLPSVEKPFYSLVEPQTVEDCDTLRRKSTASAVDVPRFVDPSQPVSPDANTEELVLSPLVRLPGSCTNDRSHGDPQSSGDRCQIQQEGTHQRGASQCVVTRLTRRSAMAGSEEMVLLPLHQFSVVHNVDIGSLCRQLLGCSGVEVWMCSPSDMEDTILNKGYALPFGDTLVALTFGTVEHLRMAFQLLIAFVDCRTVCSSEGFPGFGDLQRAAAVVVMEADCCVVVVKDYVLCTLESPPSGFLRQLAVFGRRLLNAVELPCCGHILQRPVVAGLLQSVLHDCASCEVVRVPVDEVRLLCTLRSILAKLLQCVAIL